MIYGILCIVLAVVWHVWLTHSKLKELRESIEKVDYRVDVVRDSVRNNSDSLLGKADVSLFESLKLEHEKLRWEVENPTELKIGSKYKKDEVVTNIEVIDKQETWMDRHFDNSRKILLGLCFSLGQAQPIEERPVKIYFKRKITTTNTKTGAIRTWEE